MKRFNTLLIAAVMLVVCFAQPLGAYADESFDISAGSITLANDKFTYSSSEIFPEETVSVTKTDAITLQQSNVVLTRDTDYTVSYSNNINAGTATITVNGINDYSGQLIKNFTINTCKITGSSVKMKYAVKSYPGTAPEYTVTFNDAQLVEGTDYTVSYSGYEKAGVKTAKAVFKGVGNFSGTKTVDFNVYPKKVSSFSTKNRTVSSLELHWASQSNDGVNAYRVYTCDKDGNNAELYKTVSTNSCVVSNQKAGSYCYFIVRAVCKENDSTISGEASKVYKTCIKPATVTMKSVTKSKDKKKLTIKWSKVAGSGYEIEYSTDKSFKKGVKKVEVSGASKKSIAVSIPKNDKVYYARVRAFRRYNDGKTTVYGAKSAKISSSYSKLYSSYTTKYVNNPNRTTNLKLACKAINGKVVYPGETFSFNATVGKRTEAKGYKEAYVFTGPNSHTMGVGGGVCQVASTMFNAALLGNFKIVERHQHSQRVTYCPLGRDAAIYWGSEDFKFKNTTNYPIKIKMSCGGGSLKCSYYVCYDVSPKKVSLSVSRNGKHFTLKRKVGGKVNYTAYSTY